MKKILIACEESQVVATTFRNKGFEAYSCDIQPCSGLNPSYHIQGDAIAEAYSGKYDLMIAHPPCTFLSKAGARWMFPPAGVLNQDRYNLAMQGKEFFMTLLNAPIKHIAVENPFPLKVVELPKESQTIQPYQFGDAFSKKTLLWLKNLPDLIPTNILTEYVPLVKSNTGGAKRGQMARPNNLTAKETSKTFQGIADAMAKQWGDYILNYTYNLGFEGHISGLSNPHSLKTAEYERWNEGNRRAFSIEANDPDFAIYKKPWNN